METHTDAYTHMHKPNLTGLTKYFHGTACIVKVSVREVCLDYQTGGRHSIKETE